MTMTKKKLIKIEATIHVTRASVSEAIREAIFCNMLWKGQD